MIDDILFFMLREGKQVVMRRYSLLLRRAEAELEKICREVPGNSVIADQQRVIINGYKSILAAVNNIKIQDFLCEVRQNKPRFNITQFTKKEEKNKTKQANEDLTNMHNKIKKPAHCRWCPECKQLVPYQYFHKHLKSKCTKHVYGVRKFQNKKKEGAE